MSRRSFQSADRIIREGSADAEEVASKTKSIGKTLDSSAEALDQALLEFIAGEEDNTSVRRLKDLLDTSAASSKPQPVVQVLDPRRELPSDPEESLVTQPEIPLAKLTEKDKEKK